MIVYSSTVNLGWVCALCVGTANFLGCVVNGPSSTAVLHHVLHVC